MIIAILSDAHDNIWNLEKVLPRLQQAGMMIYCGDLCAPFSLQMLVDGFAKPIHCVLGNNDGDALLIGRIAAKAGNVTLYQGMGHIEVEGKRIAFAHYPNIGGALARSGQYDVVFHGHTHRRVIETVGQTLSVNPGEVMGRYGEPSYGLYDTATGEFTYQEIR